MSRLALCREATLPLICDCVYEWVCEGMNADLCCKSALKTREVLHKYSLLTIYNPNVKYLVVST